MLFAYGLHSFFISSYVKMSSSLIIDLKKSSAKLLFAISLLLSFFFFTGSVSQSQINPVKSQITLIAVSHLQPGKSLSYKLALRLPQKKRLLPFSFFNASYSYTQKVKVRINELKATALFSKKPLFYRIKIIPQNSGDEPARMIG
jgi:hypothetical protein